MGLRPHEKLRRWAGYYISLCVEVREIRSVAFYCWCDYLYQEIPRSVVTVSELNQNFRDLSLRELIFAASKLLLQDGDRFHSFSLYDYFYVCSVEVPGFHLGNCFGYCRSCSFVDSRVGLCGLAIAKAGQ